MSNRGRVPYLPVLGMSPEQAARSLNCKVETLRRAVRRGEIAAHVIDEEVRISVPELIGWLHSQPPVPEPQPVSKVAIPYRPETARLQPETDAAGPCAAAAKLIGDDK